MLKQAFDFKNESNYLYSILEGLSDSDFKNKTLFKEWSFNTILRHLHVWNQAANIALTNNNEWEKFSFTLRDYFNNGKTLNDFEKDFTNNIKGKDLLDEWRKLYQKTTNKFKIEDPKKRVKDVINEASGKDKIKIKQFIRFKVGEGV